MESLIEATVGLIGGLFLRLITFGRYRTSDDALLLEGGLGLLMVAVVIYVVYAIAAR